MRDKLKLLQVVPSFFYGYGSVASATTYPPYRISFPSLVVNPIQGLERRYSERLIRCFSVRNMGQYIIHLLHAWVTNTQESYSRMTAGSSDRRLSLAGGVRRKWRTARSTLCCHRRVADSGLRDDTVLFHSQRAHCTGYKGCVLQEYHRGVATIPHGCKKGDQG